MEFRQSKRKKRAIMCCCSVCLTDKYAKHTTEQFLLLTLLFVFLTANIQNWIRLCLIRIGIASFYYKAK